MRNKDSKFIRETFEIQVTLNRNVNEKNRRLKEEVIIEN